MDYISAFVRLSSHWLSSGWSREFPGYVAAALVLATFCMTSMRRLRLMAIASNFAFIYYSAVADLYPVLILHSILLPVNVTRLTQMQLARVTGKRLLARGTDALPAEDLATPAFITSQALADPSTALNLAGREQLRVSGMLASHMVDPVETEPAAGSASTGRAAVRLLDKIDNFLAGLATGGGLTATQTGQLNSLRSRDEVLRALHESLGELAAMLLDRTVRLPDWLVVSLREGLGAILLVTEETARSPTAENIEMVLNMTSDRSVLVERIRSRAMANGGTSDHRAVYNVTALYERSVWLLQRYARLLETVMVEVES
jgi:phosphate:Na+ symporter